MACGKPSCAATLSDIAPRATIRFLDLGRCVRLWAARSRQRRHLAELDDDRLRDIGISRKAAEAEAAKPFWQP